MHSSIFRATDSLHRRTPLLVRAIEIRISIIQIRPPAAWAECGKRSAPSRSLHRARCGLALAADAEEAKMSIQLGHFRPSSGLCRAAQRIEIT